jgi:hypothetical protein
VYFALEDGRPQDQHSRPPLVLLPHQQAPLESGASLVDVFSEEDLVVGVDPGLDLPVQDQLHQLVLQSWDGPVERHRQKLSANRNFVVELVLFELKRRKNYRIPGSKTLTFL